MADHSAVRELVLVGVLYGLYEISRTFADGRLGPALSRAAHLFDLEHTWHLAIEPWFNRLFVDNAVIGVIGDYWYASAHYVVTAVVLIWLFRSRPVHYVTARRALVLATAVALAFYLFSPTAPPRLTAGFIDVMNLHASLGWWGADASAPQGMGGLTNELAAFPSMHAGWALWAALAVRSTLPPRHRLARAATFLYPIITGIVVLGTGNHWTLDVLIGYAIMAVAWWIVASVETHHRAAAHAR